MRKSTLLLTLLFKYVVFNLLWKLWDKKYDAYAIFMIKFYLSTYIFVSVSA